MENDARRSVFDLPLDRLAQGLGAAAGELCCATPFARCRRRRVGTRFAGLGRSTNEINQPFIFISVLAIALLRPESPRYDDDHAGGGHPPSGEHAQLGALCLIVAW